MADRTTTVTIQGLDTLINRLKRGSKNIGKIAGQGLKPLADDTVSGVKQRITEAPRVDLGVLRDGIYADNQSRTGWAKFVIRPSDQADRYAIFVEENTRPHWPPIDAIQGWADRHGIPAFLVARKISKEGTTGIHMFAEEYKIVLQKAHAVEARIGKRILVELAP